MRHSLIGATALALVLGTAAVSAQETQNGMSGAADGSISGSSEMHTSPDWNDDIVSTFYEDDTMTTMRSQEDIQSGWDGLSEEDQQQVRDDCETMAGGGADAGVSAGAETDTYGETGTSMSDGASGGSASGDADTDTTADASASVDSAAMAGVCNTVENL